MRSFNCDQEYDGELPTCRANFFKKIPLANQVLKRALMRGGRVVVEKEEGEFGSIEEALHTPLQVKLCSVPVYRLQSVQGPV